jgi:hypothetical protein
MLKRRIEFIKITNIFLFFIILTGCAPQISMRQTIYRNEVTVLDALSMTDRETFDKNWKIADVLLEQDKMAWIATDSILPRLTDNEKKLVKGYVIDGSLNNGVVYFFSEDMLNEIEIVGTASFMNSNLIATTKGDMDIATRVLKMAKCIQKAKQINEEYIANQKVNYNSYSIISDNRITVYLAPGSINGYFILCGGIKTEFDEDLHIIQNTELHKSIVVFKSKNMGDIMARSSSVTPVINEIDILQYLVWKNIVYNQMISTEKYGFLLYNVPDEGKIIKRIFTQEEMKKNKEPRL